MFHVLVVVNGFGTGKLLKLVRLLLSKLSLLLIVGEELLATAAVSEVCTKGI